MQCYEGLDESKALYEWKYGKQLLYTQILKDKIGDVLGGTETLAAALNKLHAFGDIFFSEQFLEPRPLLRALQQPGGAVLLIDEIDKSDQEFEAFLLEILSDYQVTIPEIGSVHAVETPIVLLTSNSTRDLGDALKRRCLHLHIGFPDAKLEGRIIESRVPGIENSLRRELVAFVQQLRTLDLKKVPSVSETIDWARVLVLLHAAIAGHRTGARHAECAAEVRGRHRSGEQADRDTDAEGEAGGRAAGMSAVPAPPPTPPHGEGRVRRTPLPVREGDGGRGQPPPNRCASSCRPRAAPASASPRPRESTPPAQCRWSATPTARC